MGDYVKPLGKEYQQLSAVDYHELVKQIHLVGAAIRTRSDHALVDEDGELQEYQDKVLVGGHFDQEESDGYDNYAPDHEYEKVGSCTPVIYFDRILNIWIELAPGTDNLLIH